MALLQTTANPLDALAVPAPVVLPQPQRTLGLAPRFSSVTKIGAGGNAEVYRCHDDLRGETVALKRLRSDKSNRQSDWERFIREPRLMSRIKHPVVPLVHDIFPERMYKPYFAMEWIEGVDLCRVLSGLRSQTETIHKAFPLWRLVDLLADICDGLAAAHERGVLHRDIKPENIMVTRDQDSDCKLVDWGVALAVDHPIDETLEERSSLSSDRRITDENQRIGTPLYMSPEQVRREALDPRSDIFSLGVVLYDCLSLGTLIRAQTLSGVFQEILRGDWTAPSVRSLRPHVPECLEEICLRAIAVDPNDRFQDAEELALALRAAELDE